MVIDTVELAQTLVRFNTTNPPENQGPCFEYLESLLTQAGFLVCRDTFAPGRQSLIALLHLGETENCLCLGGHADTVCVGGAPWDGAPFAGDIRQGCLYGRGASDMKAGLAALVSAAVTLAPVLRKAGHNLMVQIYGGEETGCQGSFHVQETTNIRPGAVLIGEPTNLQIHAGHRGALWIEAQAKGVTSHAAMPQFGDNALIKALDAAQALISLDLAPFTHPFLGQPTLALTTMKAGHNVNAIPDTATFTADIRTVPEFDSTAALTKIAERMGDDLTITTLLDIPPVWTNPDEPWMQRINELLSNRLDKDQPIGCAKFFTDAAAIKKHWNDVPVAILGPGNPDLAHQTNEFCPVDQITLARDLYLDIAADWYGLSRQDLPVGGF